MLVYYALCTYYLVYIDFCFRLCYKYKKLWMLFRPKVCPTIHCTWQKTLCYSFLLASTTKHKVSSESQWKALHLDVNYCFLKWKTKEIIEKENVALLNEEVLFRKTYIIWILSTRNAQKYMVVWKNTQYFRRYKGF